jgi:hypothetical protein
MANYATLRYTPTHIGDPSILIEKASITAYYYRKRSHSAENGWSTNSCRSDRAKRTGIWVTPIDIYR